MKRHFQKAEYMKLKTNNSKHLLWLAALFSLITSPMNALAGATDLANTPLIAGNPVPSNVMFTLDNSGGVDVDVLLPTFNSLYFENGVTNSGTSNYNGFFYLFPNAGYKNKRSEPQYLMGFPGGSNPDTNAWRAYYAGYNKIYYDPSVTYSPWIGSDNAGNAFANANPKAIRLEPYLASSSSNTYDITATQSFSASTYLNAAGTGCRNSACSKIGSYTSTGISARYYTWTDTNKNGVMDPGEGTLYVIQPSTTSYPSGRSYNDELQNFANWFQYYRTPFLALRGYMGQSLSIMSSANVGVIDLWHTSPNTPVLPMSSATNISTLQSSIYSIIVTPDDWTQPIHERTATVWNYFNTAASSSNPPAPIKYSCQQNFNILVSPGYLNDAGYSDLGSTDWTNDQTNVSPPAISPTNYDGTVSGPNWGKLPYTDSYSNTLADWTAYYYDQTLRTDLTSGQVPIPTGSRETNKNLHMTTYVLAPGAIPQISTSNPGTALANAQTVDLWDPPYTGAGSTFAWPKPCFVCQNTIDDMWHAAVNGRGIFVNSSNIYSGLQTIVDNILKNTGAGASVAVVNANITSTSNAAYASSYVSGSWSGDLGSYPISTTDASISKTATWTAQAQLDSLSLTKRYIGTFDGSKGVGFNSTGLTTAMQNALNSPTTPPGPSDNAAVLAYLRGTRTGEGTVYRTRDHLLADIVDAAPVAVGAPKNGYADAGYQKFFGDQSGRQTAIYQGANDGMLHAFNASTGAEMWAYVPGLLFNSRMSGYPQTSTLVNLSMLQSFNHLYYVDSTPIEGDVDMANTGGTAGTANWKSILVGGLGKGGNGYYALDVTSPAAGADADVASKVLWEFPNSTTSTTTAANIGYSYGTPLIVKTAASGWVVLVTSGYNNGTTTSGDGKGHLFVLNPSNGNVIADLATSVGSPATPSGLAQISAFAYDSNIDATVDYVYGGDLQGNVWRFDLSGATTSSWAVAQLATLVDGSSNPQPITTAPELALLHGHRMVYVGTGEYLGKSDIPSLASSNASSSQTQTLYGLWDNQTATPLITSLRSNLVQQTLTVSADGNSVTDTSVAAPNFSATQEGWYVDLPTTGERVNQSPVLVNGTLDVVTNIPSSANICQPGGTSYQYFLNYQNGGAINDSTAGFSLGNQLSSAPVIIEVPPPNGDPIFSQVRGSNGSNTVTSVPTTQPGVSANRVQWREILTQ
jgi:type IV pilus assembly protein PilY1